MSFWEIIIKILTIAGSIGLFLYGMKLMSESLQKVAGKNMRNILSAISSKPSRGIISGLLITGIIQSSSATTVMVVSFVNAGLMSLIESFGVIMGANIGTTITGWIISLLGFGKTFDINVILLPLIALSLPLLFSPKSRLRFWAEFIIGFVILFMGLQFLKGAAPTPEDSPGFITFLGNFTNYGYGSVLIFVLIGAVFTVIFQSSSAMMAFTFVIAIDGWIPFELAAAMVLGENLGTTITANIAALVGNIDAKRAAFFHFMFNLIGIIWALVLFNPLLAGVDWIIRSVEGSSPFLNVAIIPISLSLFHTSFNILNTLILVGFLRFMKELIEKIIRSRSKSEVQYRLTYIDSFYMSTSELSLVQAKKEIVDYGLLVQKMYLMIPELLMEKRSKKYISIYKKILKYEKIIDNIEIEIASYLTRLSESKLSMKSTREIQVMLKIISEIESIGDACHDMARTIKKKNDEKIYFIQEQRNNLNSLFAPTEKALNKMIRQLSGDYDKADMDDMKELTSQVEKSVLDLQKKHITSINKEHYSYQTGIYYINLVELLKKATNYASNVSQALTDLKPSL